MITETSYCSEIFNSSQQATTWKEAEKQNLQTAVLNNPLLYILMFPRVTFKLGFTDAHTVLNHPNNQQQDKRELEERW